MVLLQQCGHLQAKKLLNDLNGTMQKPFNQLNLFQAFSKQRWPLIFQPQVQFMTHFLASIPHLQTKYANKKGNGLNTFHSASLFWNLLKLTSSNVVSIVQRPVPGQTLGFWAAWRLMFRRKWEELPTTNRHATNKYDRNRKCESSWFWFLMLVSNGRVGKLKYRNRNH